MQVHLRWQQRCEREPRVHVIVFRINNSLVLESWLHGEGALIWHSGQLNSGQAQCFFRDLWAERKASSEYVVGIQTVRIGDSRPGVGSIRLHLLLTSNPRVPSNPPSGTIWKRYGGLPCLCCWCRGSVCPDSLTVLKSRCYAVCPYVRLVLHRDFLQVCSAPLVIFPPDHMTTNHGNKWDENVERMEGHLRSHSGSHTIKLSSPHCSNKASDDVIRTAVVKRYIEIPNGALRSSRYPESSPEWRPRPSES